MLTKHLAALQQKNLDIYPAVIKLLTLSKKDVMQHIFNFFLLSSLLLLSKIVAGQKISAISTDPNLANEAPAIIEGTYDNSENFIDVPGVRGTNASTDFWGIGVEGIGGYIGVNGFVEGYGGIEDSNVYYGTLGNASYIGSGSCQSGFATGYGGSFTARAFDINYGVLGSAEGGRFNYGIYGKATASCEGGETYAGFFNGDLGYIGSLIKIPSNQRRTMPSDDINELLDRLMRLRPRANQINGEQKQAASVNTIEYGFDPAEMEEVFPELVVTQKHAFPTNSMNKKSKSIEEVEVKGIKTLNMIPVLTKAIQEQQEIINKKEEEINDLRSRLVRLENTFERLVNIKDTDINSAVLYQNQPNPFNNTTTINFDLPSEAISSVLHIFDFNGKLVKTIVIEKSESQYILNTNSLKSGIYAYSLVIDGVVVDTKTMVLTR